MGKRIVNFKGRIKGDLVYFILNSFVCYIPFWFIRKFLYKLFGLKILNDSRIAIKTIVISPKKISIGKRTIINEGCFLDGRGGLIIGNDVSISVASKIITASHKSSSSTFEYKQVKQLLKIMYGLESVQ